MNRKQLLERWQTLVREQRDYLDNTVPARVAADSNFDFTKDEAFKSRSEEISRLEPQIAALKKIEEQERSLDNPGMTRGSTQPGFTAAEDDEVKALRAFAKRHGCENPSDQDITHLREFAEYMMRGQVGGFLQTQYRSNLASNGTTTGGYGVPTAWVNAIVTDVNALETVRRLGAQVIPITGTANLTTMAKVNGAFVAEAGSIGATDPTVGRVTLSPQLLACSTIGSWAFFNRFLDGQAEAAIRRAFSQGIAEVEGDKFLTGSGSGAPQGLTVGGTSALTAGSATVVTAAELTSLYMSVHPQYQGNGNWIMNGTTISEISILEDGNGNRIVQPNMQQGLMTLWGRPIINEPLMPNTATGLKPIVFADLASGYVIGEEVGLTVLMDPYTQAGTGETKMYMYKYVDGRVKVPAAVKYITMA
jgi:HK97 family phage major capsid protein